MTESRHHVRDADVVAPPDGGRRLLARAFWLRQPGAGEIRPLTLPDAVAGEVLVRALHSGISRGSEMLVFRGQSYHSNP